MTEPFVEVAHATRNAATGWRQGITGTRSVLDQFEDGQYREVLTVAVVSTFAVGRLTPLRAAYFFGSAAASNWRMAALKRSTSSLGTAIESW